MNRDSFRNVKKKSGFVRFWKKLLLKVYLTPKWVIHKTNLMRLMTKWLPNYSFTARV